MDDDAFVTDKEIAWRWGVSEKIARAAICVLEKHPGFPPRDKLLGNKRYWPAVKAFMRARYGLIIAPPSIPDGEENLDAITKDRGRPRPRLAAPR